MRLPDEAGTPCQRCGTSAVLCGRQFRLLEEWCCAYCRQVGARQAHEVIFTNTIRKEQP